MRRYVLLIQLFTAAASMVTAQQGLYNALTDQPAAPSTLEGYQKEKIDLFGADQYLKLTLVSDFDQFSEERYEEKYQKAMLTTRVSDSLEVRLNVRIRARGKSRRRLCELPPIKLNLKKSDIIHENFKSLEKLKLVSPCKKGSEYENVILKEYLVYRLFNVLTPTSFQVRLIEMTLQNTGKKDWSRKSFGFVIEEGESVGKRLDMEYLNKFSLYPKSVNQEYYAMLALFQYMIGNPDWSILGAQNIKTFRQKDEKPENTFTIPYDFDAASIVDAPYATPPATGKIQVLDRPFLASCLSIEQCQSAFTYLTSKREELESTISEFPYLGKGQKKQMLNYLKTFFSQLDTPRTWDKIQMPPCQQP